MGLDQVGQAFDRHSHIAFQFSGGRDSIAALYLMRDFWPRMVVYHLDAGDQFPETREVVRQVGLDVPIRIIRGWALEVRAEFGLPTDLLPVDNTELGLMVSGQAQRLIGRFECCVRSLMAPMHERMVADGMTLLVRGTRADEFKGDMPARSGTTQNGIEVLFPIEEWSADMVDEFIALHGLPVPNFYAQGMTQAPECMGCTAWWSEGRKQYLKRNYPAHHAEYLHNISIVRNAVRRQLATLGD